MNSVTRAATVNAWPQAAWLAVAGTALLLLVYYTTTASTVAIWSRSETFAHGFLIFPISAYLIWIRRKELARIAPAPDRRGLILLAVLGFGWLTAALARVLVVQQLALVAMIPALVLSVLGWRVAWALAFPLGFLLFAVPMGEFLIPVLMNFTADFAVGALRVTGMPVYREGTFFSIPSGNWSVVEACSGIRYLIASLTLGTLYAYLTYRSTSRRLLFALASLVVPVLANGMRAYMIVMIAHLSDMKLARGVDHYIYGWVFFGIVMLLLFWVGSFWREDEPHTETASAPKRSAEGASQRSLFAAVTLGLLMAGLWPAYAAWLESRAPHDFRIQLNASTPAKGWEPTEPFTEWRPTYKGTDAQVTQTYRKGSAVVAVTLAYYRYQRQDAELINTQNLMIGQEDPVWSKVGETHRSSGLPGAPTEVVQTQLRAQKQRLLIWHWNWLSGPTTVNPYWAKLYEARARLLGRWDDAAAIIVYVPYEERPELAAEQIQAFLRDMLPPVMVALEQAADTR